MGSSDTFRVDYTKVVEEDEGVYVPDVRARYEYTNHFGKFDFKDLKRRYRSAKLDADRKAAASLFVPREHRPPSVLRTAIRKRRLVQATLAGWKQSVANGAPAPDRDDGDGEQ